MEHQLQQILAPTIGLILGVLLVLPQRVEAQHVTTQAGQIPSLHSIRISNENGECIYRIEEQADQDTLSVEPRDVVRVYRSAGMRARVRIENDPSTGDPGTRGPAERELGAGVAIGRLAVRDRLGRETEHKVSISCCIARLGADCTWSEARAPGDPPNLGSSRIDYRAIDVAARSGPRADVYAEAEEGQGGVLPGGPSMKVSE